MIARKSSETTTGIRLLDLQSTTRNDGGEGRTNGNAQFVIAACSGSRRDRARQDLHVLATLLAPVHGTCLRVS